MNAGQQRQALAVHDVRAVRRGEAVADRCDHALADEDVADGVETCSGIDHPRTPDHERREHAVADREQSGRPHHATASRSAATGAGTELPSRTS